MKKWFNELPPGYQFLVIAILIFVAWKGINYYQSYQKSASSNLGAQTDLQVLNQSGIKPSYADYTFESWADKLYNAMKGLGTDEEKIFSVFNALKNDADFVKLDQSFGIRDTYSMKEWLNDDLSSTNINTINSGLKTKGMTKRI